MTMLYSTQGTINFPIASGNTLIVRNISGSETVSGSSASREDATGTLGSGVYVYGPQSSAATISISTSGQCDYSVVAGDPTPPRYVTVSKNTSGVDELSTADKAVMANSGYATSGLSTAAKKAASIVPSLSKFVIALRRAQRRAGPAFVLVVGDSTTAALGANTGTNGYVGAGKMSVARQMAKMLGWRDSAVIGCQCGTDVTPDQYDERVAIGSGWSINPNVAYLGGALVTGASGAAGAYTITPKGDKQGYDRVRVIYGRNTTGGTVTVNVSGSSVGTINTNGANAVLSADFTVPYSASTAPITFTGPTGGTIFILGVIWWDSTDPGVIVMSAGASGATVAQAISTGNEWTAYAAYPVIAPDLTILDMWINDTFYVTAPATYTTQLTTLKGRLTSGDVIYCGYQPISNVSMDNGQGAAIFAAMQSVAGTSPVVDWRTVFTDYATANAAGWMYDTLHPTSYGLHAKAAYLASLIAP